MPPGSWRRLSLDHERLMEQVDEVVVDRDRRALIWSAIRRTVYAGGEYHDVTRGIALGCPISPWLGALYLAPLDARMAELGLPYARRIEAYARRWVSWVQTGERELLRWDGVDREVWIVLHTQKFGAPS